MLGAGLPRTGTHSLKDGLELLLGAPCYHMVEVFEHMEHVPTWAAAARGEHVDFESILAPYAAAVDWPASAFWRELAELYPSALVVLSLRTDAETWWESMNVTVLETIRQEASESGRDPDWLAMVRELALTRLAHWHDRDALIAAYNAHVAAVREAFAGTGRLLEWRAAEGWEPLCAALGLQPPDEPFPHVNTREDWAARRAEAS